MQAESTVLSKPEVFWAAVQAGFTALTFIVVFFYTLYTRRMMRLQEESRRSEITPVFSVREQILSMQLTKDPNGTEHAEYGIYAKRIRLILGVRNIGKGPAVLVHAWHQPVSDSFSVGHSTLFNEQPGARFASVHAPTEDLGELGDGLLSTLMELLPNETGQLYVRHFNPERRWLFVLECADIANGRHQLQVLREAGEDNPPTTWKMAHAMGDTLGERIVNAVRRFVEVRLSIEKHLSKLED